MTATATAVGLTVGLQSLHKTLVGGEKQLLRVVLLLQESGTVHKLLRRVPDDIAQGVRGVDLEQVLQDGQEGHLLGAVTHLRITEVMHRSS